MLKRSSESQGSRKGFFNGDGSHPGGSEPTNFQRADASQLAGRKIKPLRSGRGGGAGGSGIVVQNGGFGAAPAQTPFAALDPNRVNGINHQTNAGPANPAGAPLFSGAATNGNAPGSALFGSSNSFNFNPPSTSFSFNAPTNAAPNPFAKPADAPPPTFSFGAPSDNKASSLFPKPSGAQSNMFSFNTAAGPQSGGLFSGAPGTKPSGMFNFGAPAEAKENSLSFNSTGSQSGSFLNGNAHSQGSLDPGDAVMAGLSPQKNNVSITPNKSSGGALSTTGDATASQGFSFGSTTPAGKPPAPAFSFSGSSLFPPNKTADSSSPLFSSNFTSTTSAAPSSSSTAPASNLFTFGSTATASAAIPSSGPGATPAAATGTPAAPFNFFGASSNAAALKAGNVISQDSTAQPNSASTNGITSGSAGFGSFDFSFKPTDSKAASSRAHGRGSRPSSSSSVRLFPSTPSNAQDKPASSNIFSFTPSGAPTTSSVSASFPPNTPKSISFPNAGGPPTANQSSKLAIPSEPSHPGEPPTGSGGTIATDTRSTLFTATQKSPAPSFSLSTAIATDNAEDSAQKESAAPFQFQFAQPTPKRPAAALEALSEAASKQPVAEQAGGVESTPEQADADQLMDRNDQEKGSQEVARTAALEAASSTANVAATDAASEHAVESEDDEAPATYLPPGFELDPSISLAGLSAKKASNVFLWSASQLLPPDVPAEPRSEEQEAELFKYRMDTLRQGFAQYQRAVRESPNREALINYADHFYENFSFAIQRLAGGLVPEADKPRPSWSSFSPETASKRKRCLEAGEALVRARRQKLAPTEAEKEAGVKGPTFGFPTLCKRPREASEDDQDGGARKKPRTDAEDAEETQPAKRSLFDRIEPGPDATPKAATPSIFTFPPNGKIVFATPGSTPAAPATSSAAEERPAASRERTPEQAGAAAASLFTQVIPPTPTAAAAQPSTTAASFFAPASATSSAPSSGRASPSSLFAAAAAPKAAGAAAPTDNIFGFLAPRANGLPRPTLGAAPGSVLSSAAPSRVTTPGLTTGDESAGGSVAGGDDGGGVGGGGGAADDAMPAETQQADLAQATAGEEGEAALLQARAKASAYGPGKKEWLTKGVGELRVLKNAETGKVRVLLRADGSGKVVANAALLPGAAYGLASAKVVNLPVATPGGVERWILTVKTADVARELSGLLEANKGN